MLGIEVPSAYVEVLDAFAARARAAIEARR